MCPFLFSIVGLALTHPPAPCGPWPSAEASTLGVDTRGVVLFCSGSEGDADAPACLATDLATKKMKTEPACPEAICQPLVETDGVDRSPSPRFEAKVIGHEVTLCDHANCRTLTLACEVKSDTLKVVSDAAGKRVVVQANSEEPCFETFELATSKTVAHFEIARTYAAATTND